MDLGFLWTRFPLRRALGHSPPFSKYCGLTHLGFSPVICLSSGSVRTYIGTADTHTRASFCPGPWLNSALQISWQCCHSCFCGLWQHINLQTASHGSYQNSHFTSWLSQAHHQWWHGQVRDRKATQAKLIFLPIKCETLTMCTVKQEESLWNAWVERLPGISCQLSAKAWSRVIVLVVISDFYPVKFLELIFWLDCSEMNALNNKRPFPIFLIILTCLYLSLFHDTSIIFFISS